MTDLTTLSRMLDEATGPSRKLDAVIFAVFNPKEAAQTAYDPMWGSGPAHIAPDYTFSIDAAFAFKNRVLPDWKLTIVDGDGAFLLSPDGKTYVAFTGSRIALTIVRVVVQAMAAKMQEDRG